MSTFVIVPGAWDTPSAVEPVLGPLESAGHDVIVVDLPCGNADATLEEYADAVRALNIDMYVVAAEPAERDAVRIYLERTQRPQGIAALRQKWRGEQPASRRRTYILTTADTLVPPEAQRVMAASVGADIVEIAADHGTFREQPERLAALLVAASQ